ncbi:hypothetical protein ACHAQC_007817 [Fusarium culmorum]
MRADHDDSDSDEYVPDDKSDTSSLHGEEYPDKLTVASGDDEQEVTHFIDQLRAGIASHNDADHPGLIPGLRSTISLFHHQRRAVAAALFAKNSRFKVMILADPPGLGKTLSALTAIAVWTARTGGIKGPCIIVTPRSSCQQWMTEIENFFEHVCAAGSVQAGISLALSSVTCAGWHHKGWAPKSLG